MTLAAVRPDSWNLPLLLHVAGAMVLVGALAIVATALVMAWRGQDAALTRLAYRTLLWAAVPAYLVQRITAEWVASEEDAPDDATWISIGYIVADTGLLLLVAATVLTGLAARRLRRDPADRSPLARVAAVLTFLMIAGYAVSIWAMTTKPD